MLQRDSMSTRAGATISSVKPPLRIGYLPLYVDYYEGICPDFPREKGEVALRCAGVLKEFGELLWDGELIRDVEGASAAGRRFAAQQADCIVVLPTIAVFAGIPWAALEHRRKPVLIWNAQQIQTVGAGYTMLEIVRNTGQIGTQALANTLFRHGHWFRVITGYEYSQETGYELSRFFRILRVVQTLKTARLLAIGDPFPLMTDILLDENTLARCTGATVARVSIEELTRHYCGVSQEQIAAHIGRLREQHRVEDISVEELERSVRLCEAVQGLVERHEATAGSLNCHGTVCLRNPSIGITACYSLGVQNQLGRPFTCTGDLCTAVALLLLKDLTGVAMYTEVQVMDEVRGALVIANSGEGEDKIRHVGSISTVRGTTNFAGLHGRGASFSYPLRAGPATIVSFTPGPNSERPFRLIVAEGDILDEPLSDAGALAGFFRFQTGDLRTGYRRWLEAGAVHHAATTIGHWATDLIAIGQLLEIDVVVV